MEGSLDLYVLNMSGWKLHTFFDANDEEKAVQTAIDTKDARGFQAVCLVNDDIGRMLYCHNSLGENFTYTSFQRSLRDGFKPPKSAKQQAEAAGKKSASGFDEGEGEDEDGETEGKKGFNFEINLPKVKKETQILVGGGASINILILLILVIFNFDPTAIAALMSATILATLWGILFDPFKINADEKTKKLIAEENVRKQKFKYCKKLLSQILTEGKQQRWSYAERKMVGDSHFALMLFFAGACDEMASRFENVELVSLHNLVAKSLNSIGILETVAMQSFSEIHEYLLYPRYARMFNFGQGGIRRLLDTGGQNIGIKQALDDWEIQKEEEQTQRQKEAEDQSCSAVMFTDIVSFTQQVHEKGNDWMVDVLHAHNEIVRVVLRSYGGREVKHTGDGIMASFKTVEDAIKGAIAMEQGFAAFVEKVPHRHFEVRCGMSAGQPVHMDGDLFGTPVNMAARVMPFAGGGQIAISQETYDILKTMPFQFTEVPGVTLKGFEGLHSIWLVGWEGIDLLNLPETAEAASTSTQQQQPAAAPSSTSGVGVSA